MTAKELRMWHWQRAMNARKKANTYRNKEGRHSASLCRQNDGRADFHIKCVQVLNEFLPNTTAEQDWALIENFANVASRR